MKQAVQLSVLAAVNIGIAFVFQWYTLTQLGAGIETDALFAGMTLPQFVLAVISGSLMHVLVPLLAGENTDSLRHDAWGFFILVGGGFCLLATVLYVSATWWIPLTVPGFSSQGQALTVDLTRIQLVGMVFSAVNGVQWATYHAQQKFIWAEFCPIISSILGLVLLIWFLPIYGVTAAAWISTLRIGLQTLLLLPGLGKPVWPDLKSSSISAVWRRIKPLLLGTAYYKTDPFVDRFLLSTASSGSLSLYYLAQQMYSAATQVINKSIVSPVVPVLSKLHKENDRNEFWKVYRRKLFQTSMIGILGFFILGLFGQWILTLLIGHGNITTDNVEHLWWIMISLSGMFIGGIVGQIVTSAFYAIGNTKTVIYMAVSNYTIYIPVKIIAFNIWGVFGLAISTTIYLMTNMVLLIYLFSTSRF